VDAEKYNRSVSLLCPTCGSDQFSRDGEEGPSQLATCARCGLKITHDDLIRANTESINEHVKEIGKDVAKDIREELAKAFRGSKFFSVK